MQAPAEVLQWSHRWPRIVAALEELDADVVCLQEVTHFSDAFQPAMAALGFSGEASPCPVPVPWARVCAAEVLDFPASHRR